MVQKGWIEWMLWTENTNFAIKIERLDIMDVKVFHTSFCFRTNRLRFKSSVRGKDRDFSPKT